MNRKRYHELMTRLERAGFSFDEANALRRIEMTLSRWSEHECNGTIQRDGEDGDGKPRCYWEDMTGEHHRGGLIPDRERGALKRLDKLMESHPDYVAYHQSDPRGCALYLVPKATLGDKDINGYYSSYGLAVCE